MNKLRISIFIALFLLCTSFASALITSSSSSVRDVTYQSYPSLTSSDINTYWPIVDDRDNAFCRNRQDVLLQVAPAGCQPTVVRSDLLAEQNVPVLCQLDALQINPLLDIKSIDSMTFSGRYPKEVSTTGFYPARAALSSGDRLLNNPILNNVGYVVVVLKRQQNESALPESVSLNLTARLRYDSNNAFGVGQASFILPEQSEAQFGNASFKNSFWQGRYFIRADSVTADRATIVLYYQDRRITSVNVERGKQSAEIFVPGMSTCQASLKVVYDGFEQSGRDRARIEIQDGDKQTDVFDVYDGMSFYNGRCSVSNIAANNDGTGKLSVSCSGNDRTFLSINAQGVVPTQTTKLTTDQQKAKDEYLNTVRQSIEEYKKVATLYSAEKITSQQTYGEAALDRALAIADSAGLVVEYSELAALYQKLYPTSANMQHVVSNAPNKIKIDNSDASRAFRINNKVVQVRVLSFVDAQTAPEATIAVGSTSRTYKQGDTVLLLTQNNNQYSAVVKSISPESVILSTRACPTSNTNSDESLRERESASICGQRVTVQDINSEKIARVRVLPDINNIETTTNVSVSIGIEKRAVKLSPQKANEMIMNLNKSIQKWESISSTLGKTVSGLKTACFATAAVLTAKNFMSGLDGTSLARKNVMQGAGGSGGWNTKCETAFRNPSANLPGLTGAPYVSIDDCLRKNGAAIDADVKAAQSVIAQQNTRIENMEKSGGFVKETQPFGEIVNTEGSANANLQYLKSTYSSDTNIGPFVSQLPDNAYGKNVIGYNQMKELEYNALLLKNPGISSVQKDAATNRIKEIQDSLSSSINGLKQQEETQKTLGAKYPGQINSDIFLNRNAYTGVYKGAIYDNTDSNKKFQTATGVSAADENGKAFSHMFYQGKDYIVFLSDANDRRRVITSAYEYVPSTNTLLRKVEGTELNTLKGSVVYTQYDANSFKNKYLNPTVKFHESEPYKGMPAIVPVDNDNGWYAGTQQVLPVFGQQATFQSSGRVSSFWLCNVGSNGLEEFDKTGFGDDNCRQFNLYSGAVLNFDGLSQSETQRLVDKAISRINQAAQQYAAGVRKIKIDNADYNVGNPALNVPAVRCQDYMSPKECLLLFNVCDPVICPSSRCNLGGQYNVANVPETGIVGSALLCLPNIKEGIAIPVCLTGVQAGVDGFVSVMKSHRDCLQEQLQTGRTVGICDQIYSIYMCEFFWRQVAPVANIVLPKIVESAYGQGTKGGGEYLTVMNAWQQTQQSISYFTQQYAVNSIKAFKIRSIEEAGGEFCKAFASVKAPSSIKSLVEPDSPPQFHAWFSSIKYSDATVPATSQYKVYYHIFAGKDTGVNYQVYLKNPTETSFYNTPSQVTVASGFITRGQYASQTRDFTAPEGYKQLCVRVNDKEECGFQQVSTSFALNYLTDQSRAEALKQTGITSAQACTSGSVGTGITLSPNVQTTAESVVTPAIYNQGIIRICATNNPGSSSAPGRFIDVGYCDTEKVRCWIDSESTARAITQQNNGTISSVTARLQQQEQANIAALQSNNIIFADTKAFDEAYNGLNMKYDYLIDLLSLGKIDSKQAKTQADKLLVDITDTDAKILYKNNNQKAKLQFLRAQVFDQLALVLAPVNASSIQSSSNVSSIWNLDSALHFIMTLPMTEKYSSKPENKKFVDELYNNGRGLLSGDEYNEVNGNGIINVEENLFYVQRVLTKKKAIELRARTGEANLITVAKAPENFVGKAYYSTTGTGSQLYIAALPTFLYVGIVATNQGNEQRIYIPDGSSPTMVGRVVSLNGKNTIQLNPGLNDNKYFGQVLYDLLQGAQIGISQSTPINQTPSSANASNTSTVAIKSYTLSSIDFLSNQVQKNVNNLTVTDFLSLNVTHECDSVTLQLKKTNVTVTQGTLFPRETAFELRNLQAGDYELTAKCYENLNVKDTKVINFTVKAVASQPVI